MHFNKMMCFSIKIKSLTLILVQYNFVIKTIVDNVFLPQILLLFYYKSVINAFETELWRFKHAAKNIGGKLNK